MPRGVSQRKGAPAVKTQAPVPATSQEAAALAPVPDVQAQLPMPEPVPPRKAYPNRGAIDDKSGDELKRYARSIGITQRNIDFLTEDRLRQNCKARVYESMED